jgi:hypothetical protein
MKQRYHRYDPRPVLNKRVYIKFSSESAFHHIKFSGACISVQEILLALESKLNFSQRNDQIQLYMA